MQIVSNDDSLHEMSNPVFGKKKKKRKNMINLLSAEFAQKVIKVKLTRQLFSYITCKFSCSIACLLPKQQQKQQQQHHTHTHIHKHTHREKNIMYEGQSKSSRPHTSGMTKSRNCAIISQYHLLCLSALSPMLF